MTPAIVLAAGTSSRYGNDNKLLARLHGRALITHVVARLQPARRPVIVVTGHQAGRLRLALRQQLGHPPRLRLVHNPHFRDGMAASLRLGIGALPARARGVFICLGDMPCIDARLLQRLERARHTGVDVVRPVCRGRPGHPVLVHRRLLPAFQGLSGDRGARAILAAVPAERRRRLPWHDGCLVDADTPTALRRAARHLATHQSA